LAGFFFAAALWAGFFGAFFMGALAFFAAGFFLGGAGPLLIIGSSQQITPTLAQPHSSSTMAVSPQTSQYRTSPFFALDINFSSCMLWIITGDCILKALIFQAHNDIFLIFFMY